MRINFDSVFKDIKPLIDAPAQQSVKESTRADFAEMLKSVSPNNSQRSAEIRVIPHEVLSSAADDAASEGPMARLGNMSLVRPELNLESLQPIIPEKIPLEATPQGVKTPSIVDARRIEPGSSFSKLRHPERVEEVKRMVEEVGLKQGINPALSMAIVANESSFDSNAVSKDGFSSKGLFQLLDSTGATLLERADLEEQYNPFDPKLNVHLGVSYLRYLHEIFSKSTALPNALSTHAAENSSSLEKLAVAAFNAGEGRVASAQARASRQGQDPTSYEAVAPYLPESTREYVTKVMRSKARYQHEFFG